MVLHDIYVGANSDLVDNAVCIKLSGLIVV